MPATLFIFASQLDISRRRDAEEALRQAQKMEALGQLTGGIAHDFNNLLQVMGGYIDLIGSAAEKPTIDVQRVQRSVHHAKSAVERASTLTKQLLAFARKQKLQGRVLNLNGFGFHDRAVDRAYVRPGSDDRNRSGPGTEELPYRSDPCRSCLAEHFHQRPGRADWQTKPQDIHRNPQSGRR